MMQLSIQINLELELWLINHAYMNKIRQSLEDVGLYSQVDYLLQTKYRTPYDEAAHHCLNMILIHCYCRL